MAEPSNSLNYQPVNSEAGKGSLGTRPLNEPHLCPNCHAKYGFFRLYCKRCGCIMPDALSDESEVTRLLPINGAQAVNLLWGRSYFHNYARMALRNEASDELISVPTDNPPALIGRATATFRPTVFFPRTLSTQKGISRAHARIDKDGTALYVTDLDSTNGTFLDGEALTPQIAYLLHNKAALQLGSLILRVEFIG
ncbi:MAG TPA: FHA domain-containing protein [Aggregatilineales bacterium]|nr:FHA domain-containing protein [Aggregatilineales bacterium]